MNGVASLCNQEGRRLNDQRPSEPQTERHRKVVDMRPITPYFDKHYPENDPLRVTGPENSEFAVALRMRR
jgi:hypothetical protein